MGNIRRGKYPRIGEMVEEFCDHATKSPGRYEEFEDAKKEAEQKFMAINEAHEILSDPESRREYDESKNDQGWRPCHNNFHRYQQQQHYQNWQRAQYHWQQHHFQS